MNRKLAWLITPLLLACIHLAEAQQPKKVARVGLLISASVAVTAPYVEAFRQGMRELGYVEGKTTTSKLAGVGQNPIDLPIWRLSWLLLKSISSLR